MYQQALKEHFICKHAGVPFFVCVFITIIHSTEAFRDASWATSPITADQMMMTGTAPET